MKCRTAACSVVGGTQKFCIAGSSSNSVPSCCIVLVPHPQKSTMTGLVSLLVHVHKNTFSSNLFGYMCIFVYACICVFVHAFVCSWHERAWGHVPVQRCLQLAMVGSSSRWFGAMYYCIELKVVYLEWYVWQIIQVLCFVLVVPVHVSSSCFLLINEIFPLVCHHVSSRWLAASSWELAFKPWFVRCSGNFFRGFSTYLYLQQRPHAGYWYFINVNCACSPLLILYQGSPWGSILFFPGCVCIAICWAHELSAQCFCWQSCLSVCLRQYTSTCTCRRPGDRVHCPVHNSDKMKDSLPAAPSRVSLSHAHRSLSTKGVGNHTFSGYFEVDYKETVNFCFNAACQIQKIRPHN